VLATPAATLHQHQHQFIILSLSPPGGAMTELLKKPKSGFNHLNALWPTHAIFGGAMPRRFPTAALSHRIFNKKAVLSQGNRAMPQLFFSV